MVLDAGIHLVSHHYHDELELKIVLWGHAVYDVGSCRIALSSGSQLWLAPGQEHTLVELSDDFAMWVSSFREDAVRHTRSNLVCASSTGLQPGELVPWRHRSCNEISALCSELVIQHEPGEVNALSRRLLGHALAVWEEHEATWYRADPVPSADALHPAVRASRFAPART